MKRIITLSPLLAVLVACSSFMQPASVPVPTLASTAAPLLTPIASTRTSLPPTSTAEIARAFTTQGQPASNWNGIPVMPGAVTGEGDEESYVFTIKATPQQIKEFYVTELNRLGWQLSAADSGDSSLTLTFTNAAGTTLTINAVTKGDEALVLLVK